MARQSTSNLSSLNGLRVAITGGTSGLGLALVEGLQRAGADVAFIARHRDAVEATARRLPGTHGLDGDVARKQDTHRLALRITSALNGGVDVLIHNASSLGPTPLALLADTDCEDFEDALATNVVGPFRLTKALLGSLAAAAREGRPAIVVHVTSDAATTPYPGWGAYGASKAALRHMSRIWDEELREHGIRFLDVDPGDMDTPLHRAAVPDVDPSTLGRPEDSARQLIDLLADVARQQVAA